MRSYPVKENHNGSAVSEILLTNKASCYFIILITIKFIAFQLSDADWMETAPMKQKILVCTCRRRWPNLEHLSPPTQGCTAGSTTDLYMACSAVSFF